MQACSLLLGHSWDYDTDALLHGRTNTYSLLHKGKKIVLLPLTPTEIVKHDKELAEISKNDNALDSSAATTKEIKLKGGALKLLKHLRMLNFMLMVHHDVLFLLCFLDMFHLPMIILLCLANCALLSLTFCRRLIMGWS